MYRLKHGPGRVPRGKNLTNPASHLEDDLRAMTRQTAQWNGIRNSNASSRRDFSAHGWGEPVSFP